MEEIFYEKQEGSLCAQHCLNALLQNSYFTAVDLAALAKQLDEAERAKMAESGVDSEEYKKFLEQPSGNMDDSGYFSVQVISSALDLWGLELVPFNSTEPRALSAQKNPEAMTAYICNYQNHWFTIRHMGHQWFNLNSLLKKPVLISNTYLALLLAQLQQEGYSIFVVFGELPPCKADKALLQRPAVRKPKLFSEVLNSHSLENDIDFQKAVRLSLGQDELVSVEAVSDSGSDEEEQIRKAVLLSLQSNTPTSTPDSPEEVDPVQLRQRRIAYLDNSETKVTS